MWEPLLRSKGKNLSGLRAEEGVRGPLTPPEPAAPPPPPPPKVHYRDDGAALVFVLMWLAGPPPKNPPVPEARAELLVRLSRLHRKSLLLPLAKDALATFSAQEKRQVALSLASFAWLDLLSLPEDPPKAPR